MRKFLIAVVLVGAAVFAAVSLANTVSGRTSQTQLPGEMKTVDGHPMTTAQGKALGVKAAAKGHRLSSATSSPSSTSRRARRRVA